MMGLTPAHATAALTDTRDIALRDARDSWKKKKEKLRRPPAAVRALSTSIKEKETHRLKEPRVSLTGG
eukprot:1144159-Pelagomonas_calceolata.AAC.1